MATARHTPQIHETTPARHYDELNDVVALSTLLEQPGCCQYRRSDT